MKNFLTELFTGLAPFIAGIMVGFYIFYNNKIESKKPIKPTLQVTLTEDQQPDTLYIYKK
jgi:hypothetical protein